MIATRATGAFDRLIARVTMYRLVTLALVALAVVSAVFAATGAIDYSVGQLAASATVAVAATYVSSKVFAALWRTTAHSESSLVTGMLLFFLFWPTTLPVELAWIAAAAVLASASKYVLAVRGRHILNPAAAGALLIALVQGAIGQPWALTFAMWWAASEVLLPFVAVGALVVLRRTRRLGPGLALMVVATVLIAGSLYDLSAGTLSGPEAVRTALTSYPVVFLAGFMFSEPLTLPPRRWQQYIVAVVVAIMLSYGTLQGVLFDSPPSLGLLEPTPELALVIGNVVAFGFGQRRGLRLKLTHKRQLTPTTYEYEFAPLAPVSSRPGQYLELTVPHPKPDARGLRRTFSISSAPSGVGPLSVAIKVAESSSTFKQALGGLEPGAVVTATGVGGDFVWPSDDSVPLLLVAGGIGITPYLSHLRHHAPRDAMLIYGVTGGDEVAYADELEATGVRVVLVSPSRPATVPRGWDVVQAPDLTGDLIAEAVPDLARRRAYVSGPPAMVDGVRRGLRGRCKRIRTDYFTGY